MNKILTFACLASLTALAFPGAALAGGQEDVSDGEVRSCIRTPQIRNTKVIDDRNILFYMRGSTVYHVTLSRRCPGLRREGRFSYRTSTGNLCHLDTITVLYSGATGLDPGASCGLGYFRKVTKEDAEALIEGLQKDPEAKPLPPADPEDMTEGERKEPEIS